MRPTEQIEDRLRAALEAQSREVRVSADAWQQNQRRLEADRSRRTRKLLGAAAAVLAVATVLGAGALLGGDGSGGAPADGTDDPFTTRYLLGEPVEAETLTIDGEPTVHEIALSDMTGEGPNLCDRYVATSSASGGCTAREPGADKRGVAFDWVAGTWGGGDLRGVMAGVDDRVTSVRIWMDDGDPVLAELHATGWAGSQMFAITTTLGSPIAQRLVAYGRDGNVLQSVDLQVRPGPGDWLPARSACRGDGRGTGVWPVPGSGGPDDVTAVLGTGNALVTVAGAPGVCLERLSSGPIAGLAGVGDVHVAVLAPEVDLVRVVDGDRMLQEQVVATAQGSPWRVFVVRGLTTDVLARAELVVLDASGSELDREFVNQPASP